MYFIFQMGFHVIASLGGNLVNYLLHGILSLTIPSVYLVATFASQRNYHEDGGRKRQN